MDYFKQLIDNAIKQHKVVCICLRKIDWDKRHIGYVKWNGPDKIIMSELNGAGKMIGEKYILFSEIRSVEFGGVYNDSLEQTYKGNIQQEKTTTKYIRLVDAKNINKKLSHLIENKTICTFYVDDNYTTGILEDIAASQLLIKNVSFDGKADGITTYYHKSLTRVRYNGPIELKITFLYQLEK